MKSETKKWIPTGRNRLKKHWMGKNIIDSQNLSTPRGKIQVTDKKPRVSPESASSQVFRAGASPEWSLRASATCRRTRRGTSRRRRTRARLWRRRGCRGSSGRNGRKRPRSGDKSYKTFLGKFRKYRIPPKIENDSKMVPEWFQGYFCSLLSFLMNLSIERSFLASDKF